MKQKPLTCLAGLAAALAISLVSPARGELDGAADLDGDGIPNIVDPDIDNDGIPNALDRNVDGGIALSGPYAGQYIGDHIDNDSPAELDIDDDHLNDDSLGELDIDGDGNRDDSPLEADTDGDGRRNDSPAEMDIDGDGRRNDAGEEFDIDGDGLDDDDVVETDIDGDGRTDDADDDIDGDNRFNGDFAEDDTDGDGLADEDVMEDNDDGDSLGDRDDDDDDNDGINDSDDTDHHNEDDEQEIEVSLTRQPAAPAGSRSRVKIQRMATGQVEFEIDARDIPVGAYDVVIDGVTRGTLNIVPHGNTNEGEQQWDTHANNNDELPLTFEVIGKPVSLSRNGVVYFSGTVPTPPPPADPGAPPVAATGNLLPGPAGPAGVHGSVEIEFNAAGAVELEVEAEDLPDGDYQLYVAAVLRGVITVDGGTGKLTFRAAPNTAAGELTFNFAAAGLPLSIQQGDSIFLTGTVPAAPPGVGDGQGDNEDGGGGSGLVTPLVRAAGAPAGAKGEVKLDFGSAGATRLEIEVEDVADGNYTVVIAGTPRGTLTVSSARGKLRFETSPNVGNGELPLNFSAAGAAISIQLGATVIFTGNAPAAPPL
jgi:hypothetical protein